MMETIKAEGQLFIKNAKYLINSPKEFFEGVKKEKKYLPTIKYLAILWFVGACLNALSSILFAYFLPLIMKQATTELPLVVIVVSQIIAALLGTLVGICGSLLLTFILHLWIKLFKGKGTPLSSLQVNTYSMTPNLLFGWLPIANIIASIYGLYLLIIGVQKLHDIPQKRSYIMFGLPLVLGILWMIVVSSNPSILSSFQPK